FASISHGARVYALRSSSVGSNARIVLPTLERRVRYFQYWPEADAVATPAMSAFPRQIEPRAGLCCMSPFDPTHRKQTNLVPSAAGPWPTAISAIRAFFVFHRHSRQWQCPNIMIAAWI